MRGGGLPFPFNQTPPGFWLAFVVVCFCQISRRGRSRRRRASRFARRAHSLADDASESFPPPPVSLAGYRGSAVLERLVHAATAWYSGEREPSWRRFEPGALDDANGASAARGAVRAHTSLTGGCAIPRSLARADIGLPDLEPPDDAGFDPSDPLSRSADGDDGDWLFDQPSGSMVRSRHDGAPKPNGERWRVYDPVYGIIPREMRECWRAQEAEAAARRADLPARTLPPVRTYSQPAS